MTTPSDKTINLLIVFSAKTLPVGQQPNPSDAWFWKRDDARAWLEARRPLFPHASAQELVSLALLPEDLRDEIAAAFCGQKKPTAQTDSTFCPPPQYSALTASCALCLASGILASPKPSRAFDAGSALFEKQISAALPGIVKLPRGLLHGATGVDAEALAIAYVEQIELLASTSPPAKAKKRNPPRTSL